MSISKNDDIHCIIELRNSEFFASFYNQIMPPSNLGIELKIGNDDMLIHRAVGVDIASVEVKDIWLCYDKSILNPTDKEK